MPGIDDIIEMLAPFVFILIWLFSAITGRAREQPPAKTSRPVFGPVREQPGPRPGPDQATVRPAPQETIDWRSLESQSPYQASNSEAEAAAREEALRRERLARALREREKKEAAKARREAAEAMRRQAEEAARPKGQVNLGHLVPDHAAEMHLEHALTNRSATVTSSARKNTKLAKAIVSGMQDRESVRRAVIMSIVLGEPKSKAKPGKDI